MPAYRIDWGAGTGVACPVLALQPRLLLGDGQMTVEEAW